MKLPSNYPNTSETNCCPPVIPEMWNNQIFDLSDYHFVRTYTKSFLYMPLNMGKVMKNTMKIISSVDGAYEDKYLILSKDLSKWKCEHNFLVKAPIYGLESNYFKCKFFAKVFEGDFREMPHWIKQMENYTQQNGYFPKDIYAFYSTCPKCAKHYDKNYVILFAKI